jgi:hypothetical protein
VAKNLKVEITSPPHQQCLNFEMDYCPDANALAMVSYLAFKAQQEKRN